MKNLRNYFIGVGLGLISMIVGCEATPEEQRRAEERMLGLSLGYGAIVEPNPQRASAMGLTSQVIRDYDVAREGKSQIVIIERASAIDSNREISEEERKEVTDRILKEYGLDKETIEREKIEWTKKWTKEWDELKRRADSKNKGNNEIIFEQSLGYVVISTCNEWKDWNKDNVLNVDIPKDLDNFSSEMIGRKYKFSDDEKITVIFGTQAPHTIGVAYRLYGEEGKIVDQVHLNNYGINREYSVGSLKPGKYTAEFYSPFKCYENTKGEGNKYAQLKFEVFSKGKSSESL